MPGLSPGVSLIRHVSRLARFLLDKLYNYLEFSGCPLSGPMTLTGHIVSQADRRASAGISPQNWEEDARMIIWDRWETDLSVDHVGLRILNMKQLDSPIYPHDHRREL